MTDNETQTARTTPSLDFRVSFPGAGSGSQDKEWCLVEIDGREERMRFHDYGSIYEVPGLYEHLFYDLLKCASPATVARLLAQEVRRAGVDLASLRLFDVGAGNGISGAELAATGVRTLIGIDIIEEAADAAVRDRPGLYDEYIVADLTALPGDVLERLECRCLNALACVGALGFGDLPPEAFAVAYDLVETGGWLAITVKEDFLEGASDSGFATLIRSLLDSGLIEQCVSTRYVHRLSVEGKPLYYVAMIARKCSEGSAVEIERGL